MSSPPDSAPPHAVYEFTKVSPDERTWKQQYSTKLYWEKMYRHRKQPEIVEVREPFRFFDLPLELREAVYSFLNLPDHITYARDTVDVAGKGIRALGHWKELVATKRRLQNSANNLQRDCMSMKMIMPHQLPIYTKWEPDIAWAFPSLYQEILKRSAAFAEDGLGLPLDPGAQRNLQKIVDDAAYAQQHFNRYTALLKVGSPHLANHLLRNEMVAFYKRTRLVQIDMRQLTANMWPMDAIIAFWGKEVRSSWHHLHAISLKISSSDFAHRQEERYLRVLTVLNSLKTIEHIEIELTETEVAYQVAITRQQRQQRQQETWDGEHERNRWLLPILRREKSTVLRSAHIYFCHGLHGKCSIEAEKSKVENSREWMADVRKEKDLFPHIVTFII
jgi:hypothetical protein